MLVQAERQSNLPGRLEIDAIPQGGRQYHPLASATAGANPNRTKVTVGKPDAVPNMFPAIEPPRGRHAPSTDDASPSESDSAAESERGAASVADVSSDRVDKDDKDGKKTSGRGGILGLFGPPQ